MTSTISNTSAPFPLGTRIIYQEEHLGTARFYGTVDGAKGSWLGVEWDDASRGKHDGIKDGRRYFHCTVPGSGSFIRYSATTVDIGVSFVSALVSKYIGEGHSSTPNQATEHFVLGSSQGRIDVEAPGLDRIRAKMSKVERLREISLDALGVARVDDGEEASIERMCQNVQGLNLSRNLLSNWEVVARIVKHLRVISELNLDRNRFTRLDAPLLPISSTLKVLRLNGTMTSWTEIAHLSGAVPNLVELQLGFNRLGLTPSTTEADSSQFVTATPPYFPNLVTLFLDGNALGDWLTIVYAISSLPKLESLHLSANGIKRIPAPVARSTSAGLPMIRLEDLRRVNLDGNLLSSWSDVDAIASWCPKLQGLSIAENPLMQEEHSSELATARIRSLAMLDGSRITPLERQDSELFYLSFIAQSMSGSDDSGRLRQHPRWLELCEKHGRPADMLSKVAVNKLSSRLIVVVLNEPILNISRAHSSVHTLPPHTMSVEIRVLPTMSVRVLRMKIVKSLKGKVDGVSGPNSFQLWGLLRRNASNHLDGAEDSESSDRGWIVLQMTDDTAELDYVGLEGGSHVALSVG